MYRQQAIVNHKQTFRYIHITVILFTLINPTARRLLWRKLKSHSRRSLMRIQWRRETPSIFNQRLFVHARVSWLHLTSRRIMMNGMRMIHQMLSARNSDCGDCGFSISSRQLMCMHANTHRIVFLVAPNNIEEISSYFIQRSLKNLNITHHS
jgi:hypothetical protein